MHFSESLPSKLGARRKNTALTRQGEFKDSTELYYGNVGSSIFSHASWMALRIEMSPGQLIHHSGPEKNTSESSE